MNSALFSKLQLRGLEFLLARELLRRPFWPLPAAHTLGVKIPWPPQ